MGKATKFVNVKLRNQFSNDAKKHEDILKLIRNLNSEKYVLTVRKFHSVDSTTALMYPLSFLLCSSFVFNRHFSVTVCKCIWINTLLPFSKETHL